MGKVRLPLVLSLVAAMVPVIAVTSCAEPPSQSTVAHLESLDAISMVSASDGWAVGGVILHYDGHQWHRVSDPVSTELMSVSMVSATDGWAVGGDVLLHYDGHAWQRSDQLPHASLKRVYMVSATDGWAVGSSQASNASPTYAVLLHFDGNAWQQLPLPGNYLDLQDVFMVSANDGWAVGSDQTSQVALLRYHNGTWQRMPLPSGVTPSCRVRMVSSSDGWLTCSPILHYDGSTWSPVATPSAGQTGLLRDTSMVSSTQGWAVGDDAILRYANDTWTVEGIQRVNRLAGIAMLSSQDGWAVGTYIEVGEQVVYHAVVLHFDGSSWSPAAIAS